MPIFFLTTTSLCKFDTGDQKNFLETATEILKSPGQGGSGWWGVGLNDFFLPMLFLRVQFKQFSGICFGCCYGKLVNFDLCLFWCIVVPVSYCGLAYCLFSATECLNFSCFFQWDILTQWNQCKILYFRLFILKQCRKCNFATFFVIQELLHTYFASMPTF